MLFSAVLPSLQGKQEYKFHKKVGCKVCKVLSSKIIVSFTGKSSLNCLSSACAACVVHALWAYGSVHQSLSMGRRWARDKMVTRIYMSARRPPGHRAGRGRGGGAFMLGGGRVLTWFVFCQGRREAIWGWNSLTGKKREAGTMLSSPSSYFGSLLYNTFSASTFVLRYS